MVSIIILSFNTKDLLESCLYSIFSRVKEIAIEVIVVDNASDDDSITMIKQKFPKVLLIENKENVGFAKGCNRGAKEAKGEYILFLNSDTEFLNNSLSSLVTTLEKAATIAVVGGKMENNDGSQQKSHGKFYSIGTVFKEIILQIDEISKKPQNTIPTDWISGGYMLTRRDVFEKMHGFDEQFFMYVEDMEYCYRVKREGLQIYFNPGAVVKHKGQGSSNRTFAIIHIYKGIVYFFKKHKEYPEYLIVKYLLFLKALTAIIIGMVTKNTYLVKTYRAALLLL